MYSIQELIWYVQGNWDMILITTSSFIAFAEVAVRLTPTKVDDGFVHRIGSLVDRLFDFLKVPNLKRKNPDGSVKDE